MAAKLKVNPFAHVIVDELDEDCTSSSSLLTSLPDACSFSANDTDIGGNDARTRDVPLSFWQIVYDSSPSHSLTSSNSGASNGRFDMPAEGQLESVPDYNGAVDGLPSIGSAGHEAGTCRPCAFWTKAVCLNGKNCKSCHNVHEGYKAKRLRLPKHKKDALNNARAREMEPFAQLGFGNDDAGDRDGEEGPSGSAQAPRILGQYKIRL